MKIHPDAEIWEFRGFDNFLECGCYVGIYYRTFCDACIKEIRECLVKLYEETKDEKAK